MSRFEVLTKYKLKTYKVSVHIVIISLDIFIIKIEKNSHIRKKLRSSLL